MWHVYILQCKNGYLYTGIAKDVAQRLKQHKKGRGARFTRIFGVKKLLFTEEYPSRREALKREAFIKTWPKKKKIALIEGKL